MVYRSNMAAFLATIQDGKVIFGSDYNTARFREWCKEREGKRITIDQIVPKRSLSQNAFYWAWLGKVQQETGNDAEEMHEYLKSKFLPRKLVQIRGKTATHDVEIVTSTTKLNKSDFTEYLMKCEQHTGVPLPTDEEIAEMGYVRN